MSLLYCSHNTTNAPSTNLSSFSFHGFFLGIFIFLFSRFFRRNFHLSLFMVFSKEFFIQKEISISKPVSSCPGNENSLSSNLTFVPWILELRHCVKFQLLDIRRLSNWTLSWLRLKREISCNFICKSNFQREINRNLSPPNARLFC